MLRPLSGPALLALLVSLPAGAAEESAAARGKKALQTKNYNPPAIPLTNYHNAWKNWGVKEKPDSKDYGRLFRERYGLHPAPYPNHDLPMGLREAEGNLATGLRKGLANDCLLCHGGSIFGQSYIGLGNSALDFQAFYEEVAGPGNRRVKSPITFTRVRGTVEAGAASVLLLGFREPDLSLRLTRLDLDLHDDLCEDTPAWWLFKKKKTMYYTGGADTRSWRALMQFMMTPLNFPAAFHKAEADFKDIREFLASLQPPKYPLTIDRQRAAEGEALFKENCARCHGTYGEKWTYPNKVIPLKEIGTDPRRFEGITAKFADYYAKSWFAEGYKPLESDGYQAPPLDGVWATAPYLHNGSAPTLYHVLNSKARPRVFTRSYRTDREAYDEKKVGWKVQVLEKAPDPKTTDAVEFRRVYDTSQVGRSNKGHTYGDKLTEAERMAVIEYLKTL
jgi:hypothetical protein